jgi:hypothetical protein
MSENTQLTRTPISKVTGFLNRKWKSILFFFAKHAFESKLECILSRLRSRRKLVARRRSPISTAQH